MLGSLGRRPEEELIYGGTFDAPMSRPSPPPPTWTQDTPFMPGPQQPPIYDRGPQMQPPFGGGLGNIDQWNPAQPGIAAQYQPPQMLPPMNIPGRMPAPPIPPQMQPPRPPVMQPPVPPQIRPPMPPMPPMPPRRPPIAPPNIVRPPVLPPDMIYDPPPDVRPRTDHEFNVMQRERTKRRLATERAKTKKHYAKLRAQGASPKTIAKAKAKSKARSKKIKGQSLRRRTIKN